MSNTKPASLATAGKRKKLHKSSQQIPTNFKQILSDLSIGFHNLDEDGLNDRLESSLNTGLPTKIITVLQKKEVIDLFNNFLLPQVKIIAEKLFNDDFERRSIESAIDFFNTILEFKKVVNKTVSLDVVWPLIVPAIKPLLAIYAPCITATFSTIKSTGIIDKALDFLKDENLKRLTEGLRDRLAEINMREAMQEFAATEVSAKSLMTIGISGKNITTQTVRQIKETPKLQGFLESLCVYAEKTVLTSKAEINSELASIKESVRSGLIGANIRKELTEHIVEQLSNLMKEPRTILIGNLQERTNARPTNIFDKINNQVKAAEMLLSCLKKLKDNEGQPLKFEVLKVISNLLDKGARNLEGDAVKIAKLMIQEPEIRAFAKNELGAGHANQAKMEALAATRVQALTRE